jgi:hypothetical protein
MKFPKLHIPKITFKKEYWTWMFLCTLIAVGVLIYIYREPIGQIFPEANNASVIDLLDESEITTSSNKKIATNNDTNLVSNDGNFAETETFTETAQHGDGITHLARRALDKYLEEHGQNASLLTKAHKTYIEDYMQNSIGDGWLQLGQKVNFSKSLIEKAINSSLLLNNVQLQNISSILNMVE